MNGSFDCRRKSTSPAGQSGSAERFGADSIASDSGLVGGESQDIGADLAIVCGMGSA